MVLLPTPVPAQSGPYRPSPHPSLKGREVSFTIPRLPHVLQSLPAHPAFALLTPQQRGELESAISS